MKKSPFKPLSSHINESFKAKRSASKIKEGILNEEKNLSEDSEETYKITKNTEAEDAKVGNKFYNVKKGDVVTLIDDDGEIATVKLKSGEIVKIESEFVDEGSLEKEKDL